MPQKVRKECQSTELRAVVQSQLLFQLKQAAGGGRKES
jgi:hypothetical protein